jgi:hypothetical protein
MYLQSLQGHKANARVANSGKVPQRPRGLITRPSLIEYQKKSSLLNSKDEQWFQMRWAQY